MIIKSSKVQEAIHVIRSYGMSKDSQKTNKFYRLVKQKHINFILTNFLFKKSTNFL